MQTAVEKHIAITVIGECGREIDWHLADDLGCWLKTHPKRLEARIAMAGRGKVRTNHWAKPIPSREFDWCASFENDEPNDDGQMLQGHGETEGEAVDDLLTQFEDNQ